MRKNIFGHLPNVKNEKGMAIATVMIVVAILALLGTGLLLMSMREMNISLKSESANQAFHVAEAGIDYATNKILDGEILTDYPDTTVTFGAGKFIVSIDREVDFSQTPPQATYSITSTGIVEDSQATQTSWLPSLINKVIPVAFAADNQKTLEVEMKQTDPFTEYVYFMDEKQDPENYNFTSYYDKSLKDYIGDEITGTVHANGNVGLGYDLSIYSKKDGLPIFSGVIDKDGDGSIDESVTYVNEIYIVGNNPTFNPPHKQVTEVAFPATNDFSYVRQEIDEGKWNGWIYSGDVEVTLNGTSLQVDSDNLSLSDGSNVLYVEDGNVTINEGVLDGRLTIMSAGGSSDDGDIEIDGNITYQNGVVPSVDANDMLGLIANNDIVVSDDAPNDVFIDAVMLAKNGSIWYEYWSGGWGGGMGGGMGGGKSKGTITVNGSLIQKTDYGDVWTGKGGKHFGYTWGMTDKDDKVKTGYYKKLNYDERLHYSQPPYFFKPDRSLYEITWRQK